MGFERGTGTEVLKGLSDEAMTRAKNVNKLLADATLFEADKIVSYKYPQNLAQDLNMRLNYNTHSSSEYAKKRIQPASNMLSQSGIKIMEPEPFVFFEFMQVMSDEKLNRWKKRQDEMAIKGKRGAMDKGKQIAEDAQVMMNALDSHHFTDAVEDEEGNFTSEERSRLEEIIDAWSHDSSIFDAVNRVYGGSVAMYMPTDIQVNDTIVYNEDSRKFIGALQGVFGANQDDQNLSSATRTFLSTPGGATGASTALGIAAKHSSKLFKATSSIGKNIGKINTGLAAVVGYGAAAVLGSELQRHFGTLMNPNEYMAYQSTGMRQFTFTWTFLPDNEIESIEAKNIIKQFRKAAHATKNDMMTLNVPDHVIVSFHGANDMIGLPPLVIESVNVTYNPNNSSFFRKNNSPVEVGLSVGLKEITPIYKDDVERGM